MMDGVTILETLEIYQLAIWQFLLGLLPLITAAIIMFVRMYKAFKNGTQEEQDAMVISERNWTLKEFLIIIVGAIISFLLLYAMESYRPAEYVETKYKITVDETVSFTEFHNRYTILEEHADYYIVKERGE